MQRFQGTLVDHINIFSKHPSGSLVSPYPSHELRDKGRVVGGACTSPYFPSFQSYLMTLKANIEC